MSNCHHSYTIRLLLASSSVDPQPGRIRDGHSYGRIFFSSDEEIKLELNKTRKALVQILLQTFFSDLRQTRYQ